MRRPELIARQAAHPRGVLGRVIARIMALETATPNQRTLELLRIDEGCRVLEVGFGHGHTLARAAELAAKGFVTGIDISGTMVEMAQAFNRDSIAKGLIEVRQASSDQIPYPEESFDRIYAVHTLYFWHDPLAHLREIRRVCPQTSAHLTRTHGRAGLETGLCTICTRSGGLYNRCPR